MATPLPVFLAQLQASKVLINPLTSRTMVKHGDKTVLDAQKFVPKRTRSLMRSIKRGTPRPGLSLTGVSATTRRPSWSAGGEQLHQVR